MYTSDFDCKQGSQGGKEQKNEQGDKFETICGVMVDGQSYRYRCKVVDIYRENRKIKTVLHFPDQTMKLEWQPHNEVLIRQEGMQDQYTRYSTSEGETNFRLERNTYFYISNKDAARREVDNFSN
ncbi:MAG: hypothetical protein U9R66_11015 [Thermodesulfobacteriota bacterium]|nr:hypothetical protein [Thermodesulfobacteriota bacterium]